MMRTLVFAFVVSYAHAYGDMVVDPPNEPTCESIKFDPRVDWNGTFPEPYVLFPAASSICYKTAALDEMITVCYDIPGTGDLYAVASTTPGSFSSTSSVAYSLNGGTISDPIPVFDDVTDQPAGDVDAFAVDGVPGNTLAVTTDDEFCVHLVCQDVPEGSGCQVDFTHWCITPTD